MAEKSAIFNDVDVNAAPDQPPSTPDSAASVDACRSIGIGASVCPPTFTPTSAAAPRSLQLLRHSPPWLAR